jgi:hypothetical protein
MPGGCIFMAASAELDDATGPAHDYLLSAERDLNATVVRAARLAVEVGHFRADLDCDQFAFEWQGILSAYHHARRLLRSPQAEARARASFQRLLDFAASLRS